MAAERKGYGSERYEQIEFQNQVVEAYRDLMIGSNWQVTCFTFVSWKH